jgi:membrane protease YdiL (CAAX protease family)
MPDQRRPFSPLWIVLYFTLHLLWRQFFPGSFSPSGGYLILPFSFLILLGLTAGSRGFGGTIEQIVGRWWPEGTDLSISVAFILAAVTLRVLLNWCFDFSGESRNPAVVADLAVLAPLNEELIFRGLFLGILLAYLPHRPRVAVIWSAAIFLGFHSYAGDNVPAIAGVFSLGLLCGSAFAITWCVPLCIACHALYNILGWWTDSSRIMTPSSIRWGLGFFVFGITVMAWLLQFFIKRQQWRTNAQPSGAANGSQPIEASPTQTP